MKSIIFSSEATDEVWKPIYGYEGRYEISNFGRVKSLDAHHKSHYQKIMKPWKSNKKYLYITLRNNETRKVFAIHKLVLEAFVEKKPKGKQVAHYDGNPENNHVSNLRWTTAKENIDDRRRHGRTAIGEKQGSSKLDGKAVKTIMKLKSAGFSSGEVGHLACVSHTTVQRIWNGENWRHLI